MVYCLLVISSRLIVRKCEYTLLFNLLEISIFSTCNDSQSALITLYCYDSSLSGCPRKDKLTPESKQPQSRTYRSYIDASSFCETAFFAGRGKEVAPSLFCSSRFHTVHCINLRINKNSQIVDISWVSRAAPGINFPWKAIFAETSSLRAEPQSKRDTVETGTMDVRDSYAAPRRKASNRTRLCVSMCLSVPFFVLFVCGVESFIYCVHLPFFSFLPFLFCSSVIKQRVLITTLDISAYVLVIGLSNIWRTRDTSGAKRPHIHVYAHSAMSPWKSFCV